MTYEPLDNLLISLVLSLFFYETGIVNTPNS